jgi:hypothetical protein
VDSFVEHLRAEVSEIGLRWYQPLCTVDHDGVTMLELQYHGRRLTFRLQAGGVTYSTLHQDANNKFVFDDGIADTKERRQALWAWLMTDEI